MTICHVKGCDQEATTGDYYPDFGCLLGFCKAHSEIPEDKRKDWVLEIDRAQQEHEAGLSAMRKKFNVPD